MPHIARIVIGSDYRRSMPLSLIVGALLLLAADTVGRSAFSLEIPAGIVMAMLGGPYFLYLMRRGGV
ncbi:putative siderophore transport system permease protein YfhA [compost metagenome]